MSVPHPILVDIVAKVTCERYSTVNNTARRLRESGLWPTGGYGNASFQRMVSHEEAAYLLIGLFSGSGPTGAGSAVKEFLKLTRNDDSGETALNALMTSLAGEFICDYDTNFVFYIDHNPLKFEIRHSVRVSALSSALSERKIEVTSLYNSFVYVDPENKSAHKGVVKTIAVPYEMIDQIALQAELRKK